MELFSRPEREQYDRNLTALRHRLEQIPAEIEQETALVRSRFADLEARKLPFLTKIEPNITTVFSIDSHYCPACDWLILDQHKLEGLLAAFCMRQKLQSVIGNEYDVIGTADEAAWQRGMKQGLEFEELVPYTHSFKAIRPLKRQRKNPQRKGLNLAGQSVSKKRRPPKSKRLSRRQRKKGKRK